MSARHATKSAGRAANGEGQGIHYGCRGFHPGLGPLSKAIKFPYKYVDRKPALLDKVLCAGTEVSREESQNPDASLGVARDSA